MKRIGKPGIPGPIALTGADAFAVIGGRTREQTMFAVVAAAVYGKGRVVAFGHNGYFSKKTLEANDTNRLVTNAMAFAAAGRKKPRIGII